MFRIVPFGCFSLVLLAALVILVPFFLADALAAALGKLGLTPGISLAVVVAMFIGGLYNVPVKRIPRVMSVETAPLGLFGVERLFPGWYRPAPYTVIAVNVGGCIIPCLLVAYELARIAGHGGFALAMTAVAAAINAAVCRWIARPVPGAGIAMPALVPGIVAAMCAFMLVRDFAPPVAFTAGVLGPLVGADICNLHRVGRLDAGMMSIGGAGTFDGIVISGFLATLLA